MATTKIEWCTHVENPFSGCCHGCPYCYAKKFSVRLSGVRHTMQAALKREGLDTFSPVFCPGKLDKLDETLGRSKRKRRIFLGSMGDIGGEWPYYIVREMNGGVKYISRLGNGYKYETWSHIDVRSMVVDSILDANRHQFLLLTKNPHGFLYDEWPSNAGMGVSIASTDHAIERIPLLSQVLCGFKWVSIEPLLDPAFDPTCLVHKGKVVPDWVVVGGLSRGNIPDLCYNSADRIRDWCRAHEIPVFFKDNLARQFGPKWHLSDWPKELPRR